MSDYRRQVSDGTLETVCLTVDARQPQSNVLELPAQLLKRGELVVFPTETVYGLGANALDAEAVKLIFAAKGRPSDNPLIIHLYDLAQLDSRLVHLTPLAKVLLTAFSPGPLTLVMPRGPAVPDAVTAGLDTVAVRIPSHPVARELLRLAGVPVAAPSANRSGRPSPTRAWHARIDLEGHVSCIIDGGASQIGLESTVLDISGSQPVILRPGHISEQDINDVLFKAGYPALAAAGQQSTAQMVRSPGMKYRHYAPEVPLRLVDISGDQQRADEIAAVIRQSLSGGQRPALFCSRQCLRTIQPQLPVNFSELDFQNDSMPDRAAAANVAGTVPVIVYAELPDPRAAGEVLFQALRLMDNGDSDLIVAEGLSHRPGASAYMDRLQRASGSKLSGEQALPAGHIIFICTGNTCRSPMAEALFRQQAAGSGWHASSAGLAACPRSPASPAARRVMRHLYQISLETHQSRQVDEDLLRQADWILTMTRQQRDLLRQRYSLLHDHILTLSEMAGHPATDIIDPFGGTDLDYAATARQLAGYIRDFWPRLSD